MGSEVGRILSIVGGVLLFVGLIFSLMFVVALVGSASSQVPLSLGLLIFMGVLIDIACGLALLVTQNGTVMVVAGILGLVSSIALIGGIIGDIGGILGIIGGALFSAEEENKNERRNKSESC